MSKLNLITGKIRKLWMILAVALVGLTLPAQVLAGQPFALNPSGTSRIIWSLRGASWDNKLGNYGGTTGTWHTVSGSPYHKGADYYADDWNWRSGNEDCGKVVIAAVSGPVIYKGNAANGYGNQVIVQSSHNNNFAWRAAHMENGSLTTATYVNAGDYIGKVGKTGLSSSDYCHLHSVLYKNIYSYLNGWQGIVRLQQGKDLYNTGGPNIYANPFYHEGSFCHSYSASGVTFFENAQCNGAKLVFTTTGLKNLPDYGWNDRARSISIQSGKSVRIYEHSNGQGASRCISWTMWDLAIDNYDNGTKIVQNGIPSISSIRYYNNSSCQ